MTGPYDDIIDLPHHVSTKHAPMDIADRAAQFSPFAALTGHDAAIKETARITGRRIELEEDEKVDLDRKFNLITERIKEQPEVCITYFKADKTKAGGSYETVTERVKKINNYEGLVVLEGGTQIPIKDIFHIEQVEQWI